MAQLPFVDMQNELVSLRFGEAKRSSCKLWINHRYRQLFGMRDWPFRYVEREAVTINSSGTLASFSSPLRRAFALELASDGSSLAFVQPDTMRLDYPVNQTSAATPQEYTVRGGIVYVKPAPSGDTSAYLSYQRSVCCYKADGTIRTGAMTADDDYPLWPEEHHYLLVLGGMATGLKNVNDPTWEALEQEYAIGVDSMIDDLFPPDTYGNIQYGRQVY